MKACIKAVHCASLEMLGINYEDYSPSEPDNFAIHDLEIEIGPLNGEGQEIFNFQILTPKFLLSNMLKHKPAIFPRGLIIVKEYDYKMIYSFIEDYISKIEESDWRTIAMKISRIGRWEFEDYKPFSL
ncbi:MAG: immunity 8 family protein [Bacteroidota bacterium]|nr:immunity 8 family protein [Bacteroidota bacterium]